MTTIDPPAEYVDSVALSVIVVTWNSEAVVGGLIESLEQAGMPDPWELIVVDNASSDNTVAVVRTCAPYAQLIANSDNLGLAAANNQGLAAGRGQLLLICNPDVIFRPGAVAALVSGMARHPRAAWAAPRLLHEDGVLQTTAGDLPTLADAIWGRQLNRRLNVGKPSGFWWNGWAHDEERAIGRSHEAAYLVRRQAVEEVGPQDPRYVLDWEGLDWTDRFRRAGWEVWLVPSAEAVHLGGDSIRKVPFRWVVSQHRGMYLYFSCRRPRAWKPLLAIVFGARAALKMAMIGVGTPMYRMAHRRPSDGR